MHARCGTITKAVVFLAALLLSSTLAFGTTTLNIHWFPSVPGSAVHATTTLSGNIWVNVVNTDNGISTTDTITLTQAWYQENAHSAPQVNLSTAMTGTSTCPACAVTGGVASSTNPGVIFTCDHNSSYTFHVEGTVSHVRTSPYYRVDEPFNLTQTVTANNLLLTAYPDWVIAWDPSTMSNVAMSSTWTDAQTGTCSVTYTISGTPTTHTNRNRPGSDPSWNWTGGAKGLYSTAVNVMADPPASSGDSNRSGYLTIPSASVSWLNNDTSSYYYRLSYTLSDSLNATAGEVWLYNPDLQRVQTWTLSAADLTASPGAGAPHTKDLTVPASVVPLPGADRTYRFMIHSVDGHANDYRNHQNRPALEAQCNRDIPLDWDVTLTKCPSSWLPTRNGTVSMTATIRPSSLVGWFNFNLLGGSSYPGYCSNAGSESSTDKDLKFAAQAGFNILPVGGQPLNANTQSRLNSATVTVTAYDYGAWCRMQATAQVNDAGEGSLGTKMAYVIGTAPPATDATIPLDDDGNYIADAWAHNAGGYTDDAETTPTGINAGDGFTRLAEYRGFVTGGSWARTDPDGAKDVFVRDQDNLGLGYFPDLGLTTHLIGSTEWNSATRVVNFNGENNQCGMLLQNGVYKTLQAGEVAHVGTPNVCAWAKIYIESIREMSNPTHDRTTVDTVDSAIIARTIAHELGHDVAIEHHDPLTGGSECVIREPCPVSAPVPSTFCASSPGCRSKSQLH